MRSNLLERERFDCSPVDSVSGTAGKAYVCSSSASKQGLGPSFVPGSGPVDTSILALLPHNVTEVFDQSAAVCAALQYSKQVLTVNHRQLC